MRGQPPRVAHTVELNPLAVAAELMTQSSVCCQQDCLEVNHRGLGRDRVLDGQSGEYAHAAREKVMIRSFTASLRVFVGTPRQGSGGIKDSITKARAKPSEPPPHGLLAHYQRILGR